ncbi:MAG: hypothetical protein QW231_05915 [Candidatus Bathyarchaeia archaeon]
MRIIYGDYGIDFEAPVYMSPSQIKKFIEFMQTLCPGIGIKEVREKEKPGPTGGGVKRWTRDELELLLQTEDNEVLARKLGRTEMSVKMERAQLLPEFFEWAEKRGYVVPMLSSERIPLIRKFLEERE